MKKHLFTLLFIIAASVAANAQIGKGNYYIGGNLNYNYDGYGYKTTTTFTEGTTNYQNHGIYAFQLNPDFGFFLSDKWSVGIQPGYSRTGGTETSVYTALPNSGTTSYTYNHKYHADALSLGIHFRYYCMLTDRIGVFPQFGVTTAHDTKDFGSGSLTVGGNPNIVFFATKKLAVNLGFGNLQYAHDYQTKSNSFNIGLNTNINFGINYYWGKK
jgi:hypothetical protein